MFVIRTPSRGKTQRLECLLTRLNILLTGVLSVPLLEVREHRVFIEYPWLLIHRWSARNKPSLIDINKLSFHVGTLCWWTVRSNWISSTASLFPTTRSANSVNSTEITGLQILYQWGLNKRFSCQYDSCSKSCMDAECILTVFNTLLAHVLC